MVTEQIANLSAGNRRPGSNPGLSADVKASAEALAFFIAHRIISAIFAPAYSARGVA